MTHRPNPVQSIAKQRQQFSQAQFQPQQLFGQPGQPQQQPQQQTAEAAVQAQMHELALEIFARLATFHFNGADRYTAPADPARLQHLAANAQTAARVYFEQLGVQFKEGSTHGQS